MKIRVTRIIVPLFLLSLALLLSSSLLLRLFFLYFMLEFIGFLWALFGVRGMRAAFGKVPERSQVGDSFTESIEVTNYGHMPGLLLKFQENTNMPGCSNLRDLHLRPKSAVRWQTTVNCRQRGQYYLGSGIITAGDPFGFFSRQREFGSQKRLLVYPAAVDLPFFEASTSGALGNAASSWLVGQSGTNAAGVREFVNGDSLTHIHWPSTARNGRLMVKMFDGGRASSTSEALYVVVDMERSVHQGNGFESSEEYAVKAAASLVKKYIEDGLQVGLILSSDPPAAIAPDRGEDHYYRMLEALALVRANGTVSIDQVLSGGLKTINTDATVVIVTPATSSVLVDSVRQLRSKEILVSVVYVDASSFGGVDSPPIIARHLRWLGIHVYVCRKGEDLGKSLDRRTIPSVVQYV